MADTGQPQMQAMQCVPASRMELDVCGHYARPDVLRLTVQDA